MPAVKNHDAPSIIAEISVEMRQFPSAQPLTLGTGVLPGNHESAGNKKYWNNKRKSIHSIHAL
ncbi:hypothetical protein ACQCVL_08335 [Bacillus thuringiensis]|uniref:Uncharacterized protein n=1 Tax=Bacillus cereus TaxID=1396 RepID=A0A9W7Q2U0_BACCE|nr:hypothetical protein DX932_19875 [Bacillus cereus]KAB2500364.1 transposase [Bacillus cereus]